jgi:sugar phosphate isomerase/epimerase
MRFAESACGPTQADWQPYARELAAEAKSKDVRISAIGAFYANPLDPRQTERARRVVRRAIEVAGFLGVKTISGFCGGVIETQINERGGNPIYKSLEDSLSQLLGFWEPLAEYARGYGVRIAFENCPQGTLNLPIMGYNSFAKPAFWESFFNATQHANFGLEWDPSHLICQSALVPESFMFMPRTLILIALCSNATAFAKPVCPNTACRAWVKRTGRKLCTRWSAPVTIRT